MSQEDPTLIYPAQAYKDAEEFFSNFPPIEIPFMEDYDIQMVPDYAADGTTPNKCFKGAVKNAVVTISSLLALSASYMLF